MKVKSLVIASSGCCSRAFANGTHGRSAGCSAAAAAPHPQTSQQWLERMTDFTRNASPTVIQGVRAWFNA